MEKDNSFLKELFGWLALAGNLLFVLWISYNGINAISAGIKALSTEVISIIALMVLFLLNTILLLSRKRRNKMAFLFQATIGGNILFMFWMTYRRMNENFGGSIYKQLSYIGLMGLLSITIILLLSKRSEIKKKTETKIT